MPFLLPNQQRQSTEGKEVTFNKQIKLLRFKKCKIWKNCELKCGAVNRTLVDVFSLATMHQFQQPLLCVDEALPRRVTLDFQMH